MSNRDLPILASSIQADVYTVLCFSEISLPSAYLFPDFIVLRSPHKRSADPIGIGSAERSCGDVKTIKSGKRSALGSDISEKHSIVYTSACIKESRIVKTLSHTDSNDGSHSHSWNDYDHSFEYQWYQWGFENLFQNSD